MKNIRRLLLIILVLFIGSNAVSAEEITLEQISNELKQTKYIIDNNATVTYGNDGITVNIKDRDIEFLYINGILSYAFSHDIALKLIDSNVSEEELSELTSVDMLVSSEVFGSIANLYGYKSYHNDWIGNMFPISEYNDINEYGILFKVSSTSQSNDGVAYLSDMKLDLTGKFKATLDSYEASIKQSTNSNNLNNDSNNSEKNNNQVKNDNDVVVEEIKVENPKTGIYLGTGLITLIALIGSGSYIYIKKYNKFPKMR